MTAGELLMMILATTIRFAPHLLVGGVGVWLALRRRKLHPRVSRIAIVGFSSLLLVALLGFALEMTLVYARGYLVPSRVGEVVGYFNLAIYPINLVALCAMGAAVFLDRD